MHMNWLTETKIPVGKSAKAAFDWLQSVGEPFFDWLSWLMELLIDAILWVLQTPPELIVIAAFVALTWTLQRNWKVCLFVALGFIGSALLVAAPLLKRAKEAVATA